MAPRLLTIDIFGRASVTPVPSYHSLCLGNNLLPQPHRLQHLDLVQALLVDPEPIAPLSARSLYLAGFARARLAENFLTRCSGMNRGLVRWIAHAAAIASWDGSTPFWTRTPSN